MLEAVAQRQAALIADWMSVGFIHGVMNTDNMAISGETIDYGPCAFMDHYDTNTVFSSIDHAGRYAYGNQPAIAQWNLARFAETLLPLIDSDTGKAVELATAVVKDFMPVFDARLLTRMRRKIGLASEQESDVELVSALFATMQSAGADFTLTFRRLARCADEPANDASLLELFASILWHRGLAAALARAPRKRAAECRGARREHAPRESRIHSAQPSGGGRARSSLHARGLRSLSPAPEHPRASLRRSAWLR